MSKKKEKQIRHLTVLEATCLVLMYVVIFLYGSGVLGNPAIKMGISILICSGLTAIYAILFLGQTWDMIFDAVLKTFNKTMPSVLILLMVGFLSASWLYSGTTPTLIYYGLKLLNPSIFLFATFVICLMGAIITGSSWTIIGTFGVAFVGIAQGMGIPITVTAGAIVSGAYLGDKWSPMSDTCNLAAALAEENVFSLFGHMIPTSGLSAVLTAVVFLLLGFRYSTVSASTDTVNTLLENINNCFNINLFLLLPIVLIVVLSVLRKPIIPLLTVCIVVAMVLGAIFQRESLSAGIAALWDGYVCNSDNAEFAKLMSGGGLLNTASTVMTMFVAFFFAGVIEIVGVMDVLAKKLGTLATTRPLVILFTAIVGVGGTFLGSTSYVGVILAVSMFNEIYKEIGLSKSDLARSALESAAMSSPMIPWGAANMVILTSLGVNGYEMAPYYYAHWIALALLILYGFTGWFFPKANKNAESSAN